VSVIPKNSVAEEVEEEDLKVICNDFLVVKVNYWSHVFNIIQPIGILKNTKR